MPHRRCRKSSAVFLSVLMTLFLWQGSVYPVQGRGNGSEGSVSQVSMLATGEKSNLLRVVIQPGDTVWDLAERYGTTVEDIVRLNRINKPEIIHSGQGLWINKAADKLKEQVGKGWSQGVQAVSQGNGATSQSVASFSQGFELTSLGGVALDTLLAMRMVKNDRIDIFSNAGGNTLTYANLSTASRGERLGISDADMELLARVIYAEARGENFEGQVAVGAVVLNRMKDPHFPKSIREVIYQQGAFTAVMDRQIHLEPDDMAYEAAQAALAGEDPTGGAVYYYNPRLATDRWIKSRPVIKRIGNHTFSI